MATNRTVDYGNKGTGLTDGLFVGFSISKASNVALCNHVDAVFYQDSANVTRFGQGQGVCSYCLSYWIDNYSNVWTQPLNTRHCPYDAAAAQNYIWCGGIVPGPLEVRTPRVLADLVVYWYLSAALPLASFIVQELMGWSYRYTIKKNM